MKRHIFPTVEALEAKALLSHFAVGSAARHHHIAHALTQGISRVQSGLAISLTTDQSTYTAGQTVQMTLTATNVTRHNVKVWLGPDTNVFSITQNGQTIWRSNMGPQPLSPTMRRILHPGQSLTLKASWTATGSGTFVVHNQMAPRGPVATFSVAANPPAPVPPVNPPPIAPELAINLTTNQSSYTVGQNVQMTLTATNTGNQDVTVWVGPYANVFSITQNGQTIWQSNQGPQPLYPTVEKVLSPGQSLTVTATWKSTATGTFVVSNELAPQGPFATFSVAAGQTTPPVTPPGPTPPGPTPPGTTPPGTTPPGTTPPVSPPVVSKMVFSLTTNQSVYTVGQIVQMSLTATNDTAQDVTIWVGPNTNVFTITQNGRVVWRSNQGPQPLYPTVAKVLKPGQSLTLTAKWKATVTGTFVVSNELAAQGPVATFSVVARHPTGGGSAPG
jgi:uncharacterized protein YpmB